MQINIIYNSHNIHRIQTGFYSLDRAFTNFLGETGIPVGTGYEVFGVSHIGKSSFCYSLAGLIAGKLNGGILLCDFEGFEPAYISQLLSAVSFEGELRVVSSPDDEKQLEETLDWLSDEKQKYSVAILDSIGAISPLGEREGDLGEANMGRRAYLLAQFTRRALHIFRFYPNKTVIMINHWYPRIGARGYESPGGEVKKYLASVRIKLAREEEFPDGSYVLCGEVIKNRWGYQDRKFYVFMLGGVGMHAGLSAMWDSIIMKKAERLKGGTVKIGDENLGRLSSLVKAAREGRNDIFQPFYEVLKEISNDTDRDFEANPESGKASDN